MEKRIIAAIHQVQATDEERLARFFERNNRPETTKYFQPFPLSAQTACRVVRVAHKDRYYIATRQEELIGFCMLRGWEEGFTIPNFGVLVDYEHQRQGVGRQMTEFALQEARTLNCSSVRLSVHASNTAALRLYLSQGFREVIRESVMVAGERDSKIVMLKDLNYTSST